MMEYFLGVDTGATKTHALITDEQGRALGFGVAGPGNHEVVGYEGVCASLQAAVGQALSMAGLSVNQIAGAGFGIAGFDWPSEKAPTLEAIGTLGLNCPLDAVNDMVVGLIAGANQGWGVVIDAGTGTNARGRALDGREGMITGMGHRFGEYGGASDLVWAAVKAAAYEWSKRGPATRLSQGLLRLTGAQDLTDLLEGLTLGTYHINASAAPMVFQVAEEGDSVAQEVIAWLGGELAESVLAIIRQLHFEELTFEVVMIGSVFKGGPLLVEPMIRKVHQVAPGAYFTPLQAPPVVGGVMLGMEQASRNFRPLHQQIIQSACALIQE